MWVSSWVDLGGGDRWWFRLVAVIVVARAVKRELVSVGFIVGTAVGPHTHRFPQRVPLVLFLLGFVSSDPRLRLLRSPQHPCPPLCVWYVGLNSSGPTIPACPLLAVTLLRHEPASLPSLQLRGVGVFRVCVWV